MKFAACIYHIKCVVVSLLFSMVFSVASLPREPSEAAPNPPNVGIIGILAVPEKHNGVPSGALGKNTGVQYWHPQDHSASQRADVGMLVVLASPERYNGARIRTNGFLHLGFEENALYFHEEDYTRGLTKNALALDLSKDEAEHFKDLNDRYVLIEGTVSASRATVERGLWGGVIGRITRMEAWPKK